MMSYFCSEPRYLRSPRLKLFLTILFFFHHFNESCAFGESLSCESLKTFVFSVSEFSFRKTQPTHDFNGGKEMRKGRVKVVSICAAVGKVNTCLESKSNQQVLSQ